MKTVGVVLFLVWVGLVHAVPVRTGTATVTSISTANTGSTTVTVPADATLMTCAVSGYDSTAGTFSGGSVTIGGAAFTMIAGGDGDTGLWQIAQMYRVSPPTGSQTLAWDWLGTGTLEDSSAIYCIWYKDVNVASAVRGSSCSQQGGNPHTSGTLTALTGDLIVAFVGQSATAETTFTWTNATEVTEFTLTGSSDGSLAEATPTGNQTVTADGAASADGGVCGITLTPTAVGSTTVHRRVVVY